VGVGAVVVLDRTQLDFKNLLADRNLILLDEIGELQVRDLLFATDPHNFTAESFFLAQHQLEVWVGLVVEVR